MLSPELLLRAYASGVFPMSEHQDDPELFWVDPRRRGVFDLDRFHISRSLARRIRQGGFDPRANTAFAEVVRACADRPATWINAPLVALYEELHARGYAHSQEIWAEGRLIGGVYGVTLGAAFFGESMFSRARDGSKIALAYLVHRLRAGGFRLFDTQFITDHLASLGAEEISRAAYRQRLAIALESKADFAPEGYRITAQDVVQCNTHTSKRG